MRRRSPEEVHAQLILIIGSTLAAVFLIVTLGITYALIFVTQPIGGQAPNDAAFIDLLKTLAIFFDGITGRGAGGQWAEIKAKATGHAENHAGNLILSALCFTLKPRNLTTGF